MKSMGAVIAAAMLLGWAAAGTAGEPIAPPHDFAAGGAPVAAPHDFATAGSPAPIAPEGAFPAGPGCASCAGGCGHGNHGGNFWDWLTYRPLHRTRCGECECCCGGIYPPLYLYFLGHCSEHPCTACGGGCANCGWPGHGFSGTPTGVGFVNH